MKKRIGMIAVIAVLTISGLALAQMDKGKDMMGDKGMMGEGKGMMGEGMGMMHGMMMKMMEKSVVATSDGGIVVVSGNKISKYDKDLNLVKEIELKADMDAMHKVMSEMMEKCPMMGKGMMEGMDKGGDKPADAATATPAPEVDHAAHH